MSQILNHDELVKQAESQLSEDTIDTNEPDNISAEDTNQIADIINNANDKDDDTTTIDPNSTETVKDTVEVEDEFGNIRSVTVDYANKEAIKNYVKQAAKSRFVEDDLKAAKEELVSLRGQAKTEIEELKQLKEVFSKGPEAIIDHFHSNSGGYKAFQKKLYDDFEQGYNATPEQLAQLQKDKELRVATEARDAAIAKVTEVEQRLSVKEEAVAQKELNSWVHSAEDKYSFKNVFKDNEKAAKNLDEALSTIAERRLVTKEEAKIPLTQAIINKEYRDAFMELRSNFAGQVSKTATSTIDKQKNKAANAAASDFNRTGDSDLTAEQEVKKLLDTGKWSAIMKSPRLVKAAKALGERFF